jgi:death on curing protein
MSVRYLTLDEIFQLQSESIQRFGGTPGVRDRGLVESALAQPAMTFDGEELHPTIIEKAAVLAFAFAKNHGFIDGNKRIALASMHTFLQLNGIGLNAAWDDVVDSILKLATGEMGRERFRDWLTSHSYPIPSKS